MSTIYLYYYQIMILVGLVAGYFVAGGLGIRPEKNNREIWAPAIVGLIIGAKLPVILSYGWRPEFVFDGKSFMGGVLGAFIAVNLYKLVTRQTQKVFGDNFVPSLVATVAFGKIGCFLNGCCDGKEWGFMGIEHYPTQLLESAFNFIMLVLLYKMYGVPKYKGLLFPIYVLSYMIMRFFVEFIRVEPAYLAGFTIYQVMAMIFSPIFVYIIYKRGLRQHGRITSFL